MKRNPPWYHYDELSKPEQRFYDSLSKAMANEFRRNYEATYAFDCLDPFGYAKGMTLGTAAPVGSRERKAAFKWAKAACGPQPPVDPERLERFFKNPAQQGYSIEGGNWPAADIFKLDRSGPPNPLTAALKEGTVLWHGSAVEFTEPMPMTWFASSEEDAEYFARYEAGGEIILPFTVARDLDLLWVPNVRNRGAYSDAIFWLQAIFGVSFNGIGYMRMPEAFEAVCEFGLDGILIDKEDSGYTSIMICDGGVLEPV